MAQEEVVPVTEFAKADLKSSKERDDDISMSPTSPIKDESDTPTNPEDPPKTETESNVMDIDTSREPSDEDDMKQDNSAAQWNCEK